MSSALEFARLRRAEMAARGEQVVRLNPREKAEQNPRSLRAAITAKCYECVGEDSDPGWRAVIRDCTSYTCPLRVLRPYQGVK